MQWFWSVGQSKCLPAAVVGKRNYHSRLVGRVAAVRFDSRLDEAEEVAPSVAGPDPVHLCWGTFARSKCLEDGAEMEVTWT